MASLLPMNRNLCLLFFSAFALSCSQVQSSGSGPSDDRFDDPGGTNDEAEADGGTDPRPGDPDASSLPDPATDPNEGVRAFPGAQGFGALATGGRGGQVIKVTTLASSGAGSFLAAINTPGPRIIVFEVSGVIDGDYEIPHGDVTIAGQTAPGGGITIRGRLSGAYQTGVDNMIIRHLRVRPSYNGSAGNQFDAIQFSRNSRLIFDHVSASFGVDETVDLYEARDVTVQWSTIESSATQGHPEGEHNYGLINGPDGRRISLHHNLFAHHKNRAPAIANGPAEVVNNVMYNVRHGFIHHNPVTGKFNIEGNYFKKGSASSLIPFYFDDENNFGANDIGYYLADNYVDDPGSSCDGVVSNPWVECSQDLNAPSSLRSQTVFDFAGAGDFHQPVVVETSIQAYQSVLAGAGAHPRDLVSRRSIEDADNRTGNWGAYALPDPMAGLTIGSSPTDSDDDGISDSWESSHGLDPMNPLDNQTLMPSGYPAVEEYINALALALLQ